jgi:pyrroline-5-carboxylate reductase
MVGFIGSGNMDTPTEVRRGVTVTAAPADAAVRYGTPAAQAATLVSETMAGTAALLTLTDTLSARGGVRPALSAAIDAVVTG